MVPANQVQFIVSTKHTSGRLGDVVAVIDMGSIEGNGIGSGGGVGMVP